jgi:hypothetical protein
MQYTPQPEDDIKAENREKEATHSTTPLQWIQNRRQALAITSLGEYFLPLFLATMEACWINGVLIGLAGIHLLGSSAALLPFWGPPLLLTGSTWLFRRALAREDDHTTSLLAIPGLGSMFALLGLLTVGLIWLHIYSANNFILDPRWLLAFGSDVLAINNVHFEQILFIIVAAVYLSWRGMKLAQVTVEPGNVLRQLVVGLIVFLIAILLQAKQASTGSDADIVVLVLLIPIFLYLSLSTHALARITFIRHDHIAGLEGSIGAQERAMLSVIMLVGLVLLVITLIAASLFSPAFFQFFQPVWQALIIGYNWLIIAFSLVATIIVTPFYWLAEWILARFPENFPPIRQLSQKNPPAIHNTLNNSPINSALLPVVKILLPVLIFLLVFFLFRALLRRRKHIRFKLDLKGRDIHESLWSWQLFWEQFRAFWRTLFQRFFAKTAVNVASPTEVLTESPGEKSIREMYRALLKKAAARGYIRKRDETPDEFERRLGEHLPDSEPQLGLLTEAYVLTRYGGYWPDEKGLTTVRQTWHELDQKWEKTNL